MAKTTHTDFDTAFKWLIDIAEGGESNSKADRGGHTKYGISQRSYPQLDISKITLPLAKSIYLRDFWYKANCDELPAPVDIAVFDAAVNHGPGTASRMLQEIVKVPRDGVIGPRSLAAVAKRNQQELYVLYCSRRVQLFYAIASNDRTQLENLNGWINRLFRLTHYINTRG